MRNLVLLAGASSLAACTSTFNEPRLLVSPYLASYRLGGDVALQSQPSPGTASKSGPQRHPTSRSAPGARVRSEWGHRYRQGS